MSALEPGSARDRRISINLTANEGRAFVERLAKDDDFRAWLREEPRECLASQHIHVPEDALPDEVELPRKDVLRDLLAGLEEGRAIEIPADAGIGTIGLLLNCFMFYVGWYPKPTERRAESAL